MNLTDCVWYVSGFGQPWEADVISNLAEALKSRGGTAPRVYAEGGTARFRSDTVMSWKSLTFFERMKAVLFGGKREVWHLWGEAPFWWPLVRLRSRTVHTSLGGSPKWRGHPTRLFQAQAQNGENRILPTFEPKAAWTDTWGCEPGPALILARPDKAADASGVMASGVITEAWQSVSDGGGCNTSILVTSGEPSNALQAAYMTMRGVPVAAPDTPLIREVLGVGGYISAPQAGNLQEWKQALLAAASDAGRSASASARRFLKDSYAAPDAAETLENLYEAVSKGRV